MVKRSYNMPEDEPNTKEFKIPSVKEHLFNVTNIYTYTDAMGAKLKLDENTIGIECEVVGGDEEGRTLINRCSLDQDWKGFFVTRLLLKAIGEPYKGDIAIDTDNWIGRQFYATVLHADHKGKTYANIDKYNFDKVIEQVVRPVSEVKKSEGEIAWDDNL